MKHFISCYFTLDIIFMFFSDQPTKEFYIYFIFLFGGTLLDLAILNDLYVFNSHRNTFKDALDIIDQQISDKDKRINNHSNQYLNGITLNKFLDTCILTILVTYRIFRIYSVAKKWYPKFKQTYREMNKENEIYCSSLSSSDCSLDENDIQQQLQENKKNQQTVTPQLLLTANSLYPSGQQLKTHQEIKEVHSRITNNQGDRFNISPVKENVKNKKTQDVFIHDKNSSNLITQITDDLSNIISLEQQQTQIQVSTKQNQNQQQIKYKQQKQNNKKQVQINQDSKSNQSKQIQINKIEIQHQLKQKSKQKRETTIQTQINSSRVIDQTEEIIKKESKQNIQTLSSQQIDKVNYEFIENENEDGWIITSNMRNQLINNEELTLDNLNSQQTETSFQKNQENQCQMQNKSEKDNAKIETKINDHNDNNISNQNIKDLSISTVDTQDIQQTNQNEKFKQSSFNYSNIIEVSEKNLIQDFNSFPSNYISNENNKFDHQNTRINKEIRNKNNSTTVNTSNINSDQRNQNQGKRTKVSSQNNFQFEVKQKQQNNMNQKLFGYNINQQNKLQVQRKQQIYVQKKLLTQQEEQTIKLQQTTENIEQQISQTKEKRQNDEKNNQENNQDTIKTQNKNQSLLIEQNYNKLYNIETITNKQQKQISNTSQNDIIQNLQKKISNTSSESQCTYKENIHQNSNRSPQFVENCNELIRNNSHRPQKISYEKKQNSKNKYQQVINFPSLYHQVRKSSRQYIDTNEKQNINDIQQTINDTNKNTSYCKTPCDLPQNNNIQQYNNTFSDIYKQDKETKKLNQQCQESINEYQVKQTYQSETQSKDIQENIQAESVSLKLESSKNIDKQNIDICLKKAHQKNNSQESVINIIKDNNIENDSNQINYLANPLLEALSLPFRNPYFSLSPKSKDKNNEKTINGLLFQQIGNWNGSKMTLSSLNELKEKLNNISNKEPSKSQIGLDNQNWELLYHDKEFKLNKDEKSLYQQQNPEGDMYRESQQIKLKQIQLKENQNYSKKQEDCLYEKLINEFEIVTSYSQQNTQKNRETIDYSKKQVLNAQEYEQIILLNEEEKEVINLDEPIIIDIKGEYGILFEIKIENLNDIDLKFNKECEKQGVNYTDILASKITVLTGLIQKQNILENSKLLNKINLLLEKLTLEYTLRIYSDQISEEKKYQFLKFFCEQKNNSQNSLEQASFISQSSLKGQNNAFTIESHQGLEQIESNSFIKKCLGQNDIQSSNNLQNNQKSQNNETTSYYPEEGGQILNDYLFENVESYSNNDANQIMIKNDLINRQLNDFKYIQRDQYDSLTSDDECISPLFPEEVKSQQNYELNEALFLDQESKSHNSSRIIQEYMEQNRHLNNFAKQNIKYSEKDDFQLSSKSDISSPLLKICSINNLPLANSSYPQIYQQFYSKNSLKIDQNENENIDQNQSQQKIHSTFSIKNLRSDTFGDNDNFESINQNIDEVAFQYSNNSSSILEQWKFDPSSIVGGIYQKPVIISRNQKENAKLTNIGINQRTWMNTSSQKHYIHESPSAKILNKQTNQINNQASVFSNGLFINLHNQDSLLIETNL